MGQLIDLCGKAVQLEDIKTFEKSARQYVFCPCFQEVTEIYTTKNIFGKTDTVSQTKFKYTGLYPYGAVLSDQEKPSPNDRYAIKTDGGFIVNKLFDSVAKPLGNAVRLVNRNVGVDT